VDYSIITLDEASFFLVPTYRKVWFFKGENPQGVFFWSNKKINICGALIDGQKFHYELYNSLNSLTYKAFLSYLADNLSQKKKYVFVLDNASYHKSSVILNYLSKQKNVVVEFLPKYSPELNPTETCWKIIRLNVTNSTYFPTVEIMQEAVDSFLNNRFFKLNVSNYLCR